MLRLWSKLEEQGRCVCSLQHTVYTIKVMFSHKSHFRSIHLKEFKSSKQTRMYFVYMYKIIFICKNWVFKCSVDVIGGISNQCCRLADNAGNETYTINWTHLLEYFLSFFFSTISRVNDLLIFADIKQLVNDNLLVLQCHFFKCILIGDFFIYDKAKQDDERLATDQ